MDGRFVFKPCLLRKLPKLALIRLMLPRFGLGVSPLLPLLFPPPLSPLFHFPHSASTARWANKLTDRRVPYAGSWRSRIKQKPRRLSSRCRTSCFLTWIIGSRYRIVPRHFTPMASFLVRPLLSSYDKLADGSYRDAQYHRLGSANIHQIPVNCPCTSNHLLLLVLMKLMVVMSKFHSPDNYWGNMRIDGDTGKKSTYVSINPFQRKEKR